MNKDLTKSQLDKNGQPYAYFLPATSGFYSTFIGKQRFGNYVDPARIPASLTNGVESLNYLEPDKGQFYYQWCLYSAGHANLDLTKTDETEDMFRNRDRSTSWVLGDSGGFQIGKGVWEGEWNDPTGSVVAQRMAEAAAKGVELIPQLDASGNPKKDKNGNPKVTKIDHVKIYKSKLDAAQKKREQVLEWMDTLMDYGMVLDIPAWVGRSPVGAKNSGVADYDQAVEATKYNNHYFIKHRTGACKFLNVLQGENHDQAEDWYQKMKDFCDPTKYDKPFNGWAMGGQNMCDVHLVLKRLVTLRFDGLLEKGHQDWMHFLGTSKLEWAVLLTDIQRAIRKYHNENFTISFDCASPFLATANGQIYINTETEAGEKWVYRMQASADDKKYSTDTRLFKDAVIQDKIFEKFEPSPIIDQLTMKDICIYKPGDLNKNGKEGNTSWDSFTYALMMGHNVWHHVNAVQQANRQSDVGVIPAMLNATTAETKTHRDYSIEEHPNKFKEIVDLIFSFDNREDALAKVEYYGDYFDRIIGTRGNTGDNITNASAKADEFGIPIVDFSDLKIVKKDEPVTNTFDILFEV
jgi:hypothetical protein